MTKLHTNSVRREWRAGYGDVVHPMHVARRNVGWLKLVRSGDEIKAYTSENGYFWRFLYQVTMPNLASCLEVGLMAYSNSGSTQVTVVFDQVQITSTGNDLLEFFNAYQEQNRHVGVQDPGAATDPVLGKIQLPGRQAADRRLDVFPNPAIQKTFVRIPAIENAETAWLSLYNNLGQEVLRKKLDVTLARTETIDLAELDAGIYLVRLRVKGEQDLVQRLIVANP